MLKGGVSLVLTVDHGIRSLLLPVRARKGLDSVPQHEGKDTLDANLFHQMQNRCAVSLSLKGSYM